MKKRYINYFVTVLAAISLFGWLYREASIGYYTDQMIGAIEGGRDDIALAALKHGADPNARYVLTNRIDNLHGFVAWCHRDYEIYWHDEPAINEAAGRGDLRLLSALFNSGADIDARNSYGTTALMRGLDADVANNSTAITDFFLAHGANVNAVDCRRRTALYYATLGPHPNALFVLLKRHGAHL